MSSAESSQMLQRLKSHHSLKHRINSTDTGSRLARAVVKKSGQCGWEVGICEKEDERFFSGIERNKEGGLIGILWRRVWILQTLLILFFKGTAF